uniref:XPG_I_2 domain-containing protein n=1 Tax=Schistosoma mansoni TaxID=6183 RepID=A0A3Q0KIB8_SCHMA
MPIPELSNILLQEFVNFKVSQLHNNPVIIDGEDFSGYFYEHLKLPTKYGGEYLSYIVQIKQFLNEIKQCKIYPSFLFGSDCERVGFQLSSQLQAMESRIKLLSSSSNTQKKNASPMPYHIFLQSMLTDVLSDMEIKFLKSPYPRIRSCVSLATYLHHPIIASSPEYFLIGTHQMSSETSPCFIPLSLMKFQCLEFKESCYCESIDAESQSIQTPCRFLTVHEFIPQPSSVHPKCRPLIGLLLGTDSMPQTKLPNYLYLIINSIEKKSYKFRRFLTLVSWFSQFGTDSQTPIDEILKCYSSKERGKLLKMLTESLAGYFPDLYLGQKLSVSLHQETPVSTGNQLNSPIFVYSPQEANSTTQTVLWQRRLSDLLKGQSTIILGSMDFTQRWSTNLSQLYFKHKLAPFILTPIYCQGGVVLPLLIENPNIELSAYEISLPLRWMHYRLFCGIEHNLSQKQKLIGLNPYILEYHRVGGTLTTYQIQVDPLILNQHEDTTDGMLSSIVGFSFSNFNIERKWLVSLALTLAFWFHATAKNKINSVDDLLNSPIVLATVAIAVTNYFNVMESDEKTVEHYGVLIKFLQKKLSDRISSSSSLSVDSSIVHHFTSIHTVYNYLRSLTYLIDELLPSDRKSNCLSFLPSWIFFPSGHLFHSLAIDIESLKPDDRYRLTLRYWLPRLYRIPKLNAEFAMKLQKLAEIYEHVIGIASEMIRLPVSAPNIVYQKVPTTIPVIDLLKNEMPSNAPSSVRTTNTEKSLQDKSEVIKRSHSSINIKSDAPLSKPKQSLNALPIRHYSEKALVTSKKQSRKLPYHLRSTGYAARLRARLEETE